jgi:predicted ferric reductase
VRFRGLDPRTAVLRWGLVAVAVGIVIGTTGPTAVRYLGTALLGGSANVSWYLERLTAFLAYLAIAGSVVYGLLLSTKLLDAIAHRPISFALHQDLASFGLGLAGIHGALLGLDHTIHFSIADLAIPFASPYRAAWVGLGQLAFYASLAVVLSFYARRRIGQRRWRVLHYATFLVFVASTAHGVAAGTDSATGWAWWTYVGASAVVAFLATYRITLSVAGRLGRGPAPARAAVAATARPMPSGNGLAMPKAGAVVLTRASSTTRPGIRAGASPRARAVEPAEADRSRYAPGRS